MWVTTVLSSWVFVEFWMFQTSRFGAACPDHQIHNLHVIVVMVIRLSVDHWIRHYNSQYLSHFVTMVMTLAGHFFRMGVLMACPAEKWHCYTPKAAPRDRFAFSKALLGWCCSCSIGQCALIPLLSYSGSRRSVSYRSYRKRSEKLEVFWRVGSHQVTSPHFFRCIPMVPTWGVSRPKSSGLRFGEGLSGQPAIHPAPCHPSLTRLARWVVMAQKIAIDADCDAATCRHYCNVQKFLEGETFFVFLLWFFFLLVECSIQ